jgi:hypothetical protein
MVYSNGFGVKIITDTDQDKLKRDIYNYVALYNNTEYKLQLVNDRSTDAMADVFIEGESVGTWFIPAHNDITIDRPANVARRFTFFKETDSRAIGSGVTPGESINGLIRVIFYPKKQQYIAVTQPTSPLFVASGIPNIPHTKRYETLYGLQQSPIPTLPSTAQFQQQPITSPAFKQQQAVSPSIPTLTQSQSNILALQAQKEMMTTPSIQQTISPLSPRVNNAYQSGATVLGRQSYQTFGMIRRFTDDEIDWSNKTEIVIRLIVKPENNIFISTAETSSGNMWNRQFVAIKDMTQPIPPRIDNYLPSI